MEMAIQRPYALTRSKRQSQRFQHSVEEISCDPSTLSISCVISILQPSSCCHPIRTAPTKWPEASPLSNSTNDHGLSRPCRELWLLSESLAICTSLALNPKPLYRTAEDEIQIEGGNKCCNWATVFAPSQLSWTTSSMLSSLEAEKRDLSKNKHPQHSHGD